MCQCSCNGNGVEERKSGMIFFLQPRRSGSDMNIRFLCINDMQVNKQAV